MLKKQSIRSPEKTVADDKVFVQNENLFREHKKMILDQRALYRNLGDKNLDTLVSESFTAPVALVFTADWLGSSHIMDTFMEELAEDYQELMHFYRQDIDEDNSLSASIGINQLPTTVIFQNGEIIDFFAGVISKEKIREKILSALS